MTARSASVWRQVVRQPLIWAALCGLLAAIILASGEFEFLGFLCTLVGGWLCGLWAVGLIVRMPSARASLVTHLSLSALLIPVLWLAVDIVPDTLPSGTPRAGFSIVQMSLIPAIGWVWITAIGRISTLARSKPDARVAPTWQGDGARTVTHVTAIPIRMRTLTALIVGAVGVGGILAAIAVIATGDLALMLGPRILVIAFGLLIALPVYTVIAHRLRLRAVGCRIAFGGDDVTVDVGAERYEVTLDEIVLLRWRTDSDYARLELRTATLDLSLLVGMTRPTDGTKPELPPLPGRMLRAAEKAGLVPQKSRHGVVTLQRES